MSNGNETIARRYAGALADVSLAATGEAEGVKAELGSWADLFENSEDLRTVFGNPAIVHANKERVLDDLIAKGKPSKPMANFLRILLRNGRLTDLTQIRERFDTVLEERSNVVSAEIISARELPDAERKEFESSLEKLTGKQININFTVDQDIIGGVVTRIGSTVYDGSVRTKLENLREQLVNG